MQLLLAELSKWAQMMLQYSKKAQGGFADNGRSGVSILANTIFTTFSICGALEFGYSSYCFFFMKFHITIHYHSHVFFLADLLQCNAIQQWRLI